MNTALRARRIIISMLTIWLATLACNYPNHVKTKLPVAAVSEFAPIVLTPNLEETVQAAVWATVDAANLAEQEMLNLPVEPTATILPTISQSLENTVTPTLPPVTVTNTPTVRPTATHTPCIPRAVVNQEANIRLGPGTGYTAVAVGTQGDEFPIAGKDNQNQWVMIIKDGVEYWIGLQVVNLTCSIARVPVVEAPPLPTLTPTPTNTPQPTVTLTMSPVVAQGIGEQANAPTSSNNSDGYCQCNGPDLDCKDFSTEAAATHCLSVCGGDPHGLDRDNDGKACESLP